MLGATHPRTLIARHDHACLVRDQGDLERARRLFEENLRLADHARPDDPTSAVHFAFALGRCLLRMGRPREAEPHLRRALEAVRAHPGIAEPGPYEKALAKAREASSQRERSKR